MLLLNPHLRNLRLRNLQLRKLLSQNPLHPRHLIYNLLKYKSYNPILPGRLGETEETGVDVAEDELDHATCHNNLLLNPVRSYLLQQDGVVDPRLRLGRSWHSYRV